MDEHFTMSDQEITSQEGHSAKQKGKGIAVIVNSFSVGFLIGQ